MNRKTTNTLIFLILFLTSTISWSQDFYLYGQNDVDNFDQNITSISGYLCIRGYVNDVSRLSNLTSIGGNLEIKNTILQNLDGLHNITFVGGDLYIFANQSLHNLDELSNLTSIGGNLEIDHNNHLSSLDGLYNVKSIGNDLIIKSLGVLSSLSGLSNLISIGGDFRLVNNSLIVNLDGLNNLASIGGGISIYSNFKFSNLAGVSNLTSIGGGIGIWYNRALINLNGLSSLVSIGSGLSINKNQSLTNINSLINLKSVPGNIFILENEALTQLGGLSSVTSIGGILKIEENKSLMNLDGLSNLSSVGGYLKINYNYFLENLDGLANITTIGGYVRIIKNYKLVSLDGLSNLTSVEGHLEIFGNGNLTNLEGLSNITSVGENLVIVNNPLIKNLDGLANITSVGTDLIIYSNKALTNCCGIQKMLSIPGSIGAGIVIEDNPSECSSENIILNFDCTKKFISGVVFFDANYNKIQESNEFGIPNIRISSDIHEFLFTNESGVFYELRDSGDVYQVMIEENPRWELTTDFLSYNGVVKYNESTNTQNNFGLYPTFDNHSITGNLVSNPTRCNTNVAFFMKVQNNGTHIENGKVNFHYDADASFAYSYPVPDVVDNINHILTWNIESLYPFDHKIYNIVLNMPDESGTEILLNFSMKIYRKSLGSNILDDSYYYKSIVHCSNNSNEKLVYPPGVQEDNYTLKDETLEYTIRFQNTGNDSAISIRIIDTIDSHFDLRTFNVIHSSFPVQTTLNGNVADFFFHNIFLPDSTSNEETSHGFVTYEIKLKEDTPDYTIVENTGYIIFDSNTPIITNTTKNTMVDMIPTGIIEITNPPLYIRPNPASDYIDMYNSSSLSVGEISVYNITGEIVVESRTTRIDISKLPSGLYFIHAQLDGIDFVEKFVKE